MAATEQLSLASTWSSGLQLLAELVLSGADTADASAELAAIFEEECRQDPARLHEMTAATTKLVTSSHSKSPELACACAQAAAFVAVAVGVGTKNRKVQPECLVKALAAVPAHSKSAITSESCIKMLFEIVVPSADNALYDALCKLAGVNPSGSIAADFVAALEAAHHQNPQTNGRRAKVAAHMMRSEPALVYSVDVRRFVLDLLARSRWNLIDIVVKAAVKAPPADEAAAASCEDLATLILHNIEQQLKARVLDRADEKHALKRVRSWGMRIADFPALKLAANKGAIKFAAWMRNPDVLQAYLSNLREEDRQVSIAYLLEKYPLPADETHPADGAPEGPPAESTEHTLQTPPKAVRSAAGEEDEPPFTPLMDTPSADHAAAIDSPREGPTESPPLLSPSASQLRATRRKVPPKIPKMCSGEAVPGRIASLASAFSDASAAGVPASGCIAEIEEPMAAVHHRRVHWAQQTFSAAQSAAAIANSNFSVVAGAPVGFTCRNSEQAESLATQRIQNTSCSEFTPCVPGPDGNLSLPPSVPVYWVATPEHLAALASTVPVDAPIAFDGEWVMQIGLQLYDEGVDAGSGGGYAGACLLQFAWPGGVALLDWVALDRGTQDMSTQEIQDASRNMTSLFGPTHVAVATFAGSGDNQMLCRSPLGGVFSQAAAQSNWADASPECKQEWKAIDKKAKRISEQVARLRTFDEAAATAAQDAILSPLTQLCPMSLSACAFWQAGGAMCKFWQMSNWLRRPLTAGQLHYGALDAYATLGVHLGLQRSAEAQKQLSEALQRMQAAS